MKILHYFLGFPPYRTGGLTKYCCDLMDAQAQRGDTVAALWPGQMGFVDCRVRVRCNGQVGSVTSYELVNPLPVPLDEGIATPEAYIKSCDKAVFTAFLQELNPDTIHIHTLMGLYAEFVQAAKELGIKTIFTTHDYFGLCPKVTLYRAGHTCSGNDCSACVGCNSSALSLNKIRLIQSPLYRKLKNFPLMRWLRSRHRQEFFGEETQSLPLTSTPEQYRALRQFYVQILTEIDTIHFNSTLAQQIYSRYFTPQDGRVLSITHKNISDNRTITRKASQKLRLLYLAPSKPFKGYTVLIEALNQLWENGHKNFELKVYNAVPEHKEYMHIITSGFTYDKLSKIFADTDVLVAPSVWYETFGFTVLEALSFGVPVIISDHVGAKDITGDAAIVVEAGNAQALFEAIKNLDEERLAQLHHAAAELPIKLWEDFIKENDTLYQKR